MDRKIKVGVVGCGLVAQIMHLYYLQELEDLFEIAALCDLSRTVREGCARKFGVPAVYDDWQDLVKQPLDAVFVLSSGSHAPIAIAAAKAGKHVLVEKPMCFSVAEGQAMIAAAEEAGVTLMVAYNKRYDAAYRRLVDERSELDDIRLIKITTLESPFQPYVRQYPLIKGEPLPEELAKKLTAENDMRIAAAIGAVDALSRRAYHLVLLDSMVHEFNAIRGVMGEPDRLEFAQITQHGVDIVLRFKNTQCVISWVDLPGIARYEMNFSLYAPHRRLNLFFPSPFVRNLPATLSVEDGDRDSPHARRSDEVVSFSESFRDELVHFHDCVVTGRTPLTSGIDGLRDVALCQSVVAAHLSGAGVDNPSQISKAEVRA